MHFFSPYSHCYSQTSVSNPPFNLKVPPGLHGQWVYWESQAAQDQNQQCSQNLWGLPNYKWFPRSFILPASPWAPGLLPRKPSSDRQVCPQHVTSSYFPVWPSSSSSHLSPDLDLSKPPSFILLIYGGWAAAQCHGVCQAIHTLLSSWREGIHGLKWTLHVWRRPVWVLSQALHGLLST